MNIGKVIFFTIIGVSITTIATAAIKNSQLKSEEQKRQSDYRKFVDSMREKYKNIETWNDFHEGVQYVEYPQIFGYDLRLLKDKFPNLSNYITFDDAKFLYEVSKIGLGLKNDDDNNHALDILHKLYPIGNR